MDKSYIDENTISVDWKFEIDDTFELMIDKWAKWQNIFLSNSFKSLVENYNSETADTYLPALGQELSVYGVLLYTIDDETDNINITLIEQELQDEFENLSKSLKLKVNRQKQPRKKIGAPASRLKISNKLPYEEFSLDDYNIVFFHYPYSVEIKFGEGDNKFKDQVHRILDFSHFPPKIQITERIGKLIFNENIGKWAALLWEEDSDYARPVWGADVNEINKWSIIDIPNIKFDQLSNLQWYENHLFISRGREAWLIKFYELTNPICEKIIQLSTASSSSYSEIIKTSNENNFILSGNNIFKLNKNKAIDTGLKLPNTIDNHSLLCTFSDKVCYIHDQKLYELDLTTGKTRFRLLDRIGVKHSISHLTKNWAIITSFGYPQIDLDIAQLWDFQTDTWYRIRLGALGKHGISDARVEPNGDVIMEYHIYYFKFKNFIKDIIPKLEKYHPAPWELIEQTETSNKNWISRFISSLFKTNDK